MTYDYYTEKSKLGIFLAKVREEDLANALKRGVIYLFDIVYGRMLFLRRKRYFYFNNNKYTYFYHRYNKTWKNERVIEIPIFEKYARDYAGKAVLEVGNVMPHYVLFKHDVLDKYEKKKGIINEDVVSFKPDKKYDLIISISTMEHVGVDDSEYAPEKAVKGLINLQKNCLNRGGKIVISFPTNYNSALMKFAETNRKVKVYSFIKKLNSFEWIQTRYEKVKALQGRPSKAILIVEIS